MKTKLKKLEFKIDKEQGAAAIFGGCTLDGYELVLMKQTGQKVTCWYKKLPKEN